MLRYGNFLDAGALIAAHGLLWHGDAMVVPAHETLQQDVMCSCHDASISGQLSIGRTEKLMGRTYQWPAMDAGTATYVQTCAISLQNKAQTTSATVSLLPFALRGQPWQTVSMDLITSLPSRLLGNTAILVFVDQMTEML